MTFPFRNESRGGGGGGFSRGRGGFRGGHDRGGFERGRGRGGGPPRDRYWNDRSDYSTPDRGGGGGGRGDRGGRFGSNGGTGTPRPRYGEAPQIEHQEPPIEGLAPSSSPNDIEIVVPDKNQR